ncbi:MAG: mechanosensitive ion channel domain-containing protein [Rhodospirillaceae bacterium]
MSKVLVFFFALLCFSSLPILEGRASQSGAPSATEPQISQLKELARTLKDDKERARLITHINSLIAAVESQKTKGSVSGIVPRTSELISERLQNVSSKLRSFSAGMAELPSLIRSISQKMQSKSWRDEALEIFWHLFFVILASCLGYWITSRVLVRPRGLLETREAESFWDRFPTLLARTVVDLIPPVSMWLAGTIITEIIIKSQKASLMSEIFLGSVVVICAVLSIGRMILAPAASNLRLIGLNNIDANYLFVWLRRFTYVSVLGLAGAGLLEQVGESMEQATSLLKIIGLFITLMGVVLILQSKARVAGFIFSPSNNQEVFSAFRARLASVWHVLAICYVASVFLIWSLEVEQGAEFIFRATVLTALIFVASYIGSTGLLLATKRIFSLKEDVKKRYPGLETRTNLYVPIIQRAGNLIIGLIAAVTLLEVWGTDILSWFASGPGQSFIGSLLTIALLIVITIIIWEFVSALVERYLTEGDLVSSRARTLLPLLRTTLLVVLSTLVVLVTLSELGLNIGPLLAGAGVVGLAVGFGAQTLVKDIITGIFILTEDQIAVGDVVRIGSHSGLVEQLTLRTIRLRDTAGNVHIVPFSEVTTVENMTKDFSRYLFEIGVAYREDTDQVTEVLHEIGKELQSDEVYGTMIVEPLEVLGVDSFGDNAVNIRARITTKPIMQWRVGREFNRRMKKRFDELGIEIPFPHRTIYFGVDRLGNAPEGRIALVTERQNASADVSSSLPQKNNKPGTSNTPMPGSGDADHSDTE